MEEQREGGRGVCLTRGSAFNFQKNWPQVPIALIKCHRRFIDNNQLTGLYGTYAM
jgi:hypothetical protein